MSLLARTLFIAGLVIASGSAGAAPARLPAPDSAEYCVAVQQILANTGMVGENTVFTDMPSYRHSKPAPQPLMIYQVVTYRGSLPIVVSCKVKTAAHLRAVYGEEAAGEQQFCPAVTRLARDEAVAELRAAGDTAAADRAAAFVVDDDEPVIAGTNYLADFQPSYLAEDGQVHLHSPGLFQNYDHWITWFLPKKFQGQSYCHLPTVPYLKALATGAMEPGTVVTTAEDAPVTPQPES